MESITSLIIQIASLITAIGVIVGLMWKLHKMMNKVQRFVDAQEKLIADVKSIKGEQKLTYTALSACLDGLEQLGANHTVPVAKAQLTDWLNERAHDD